MNKPLEEERRRGVLDKAKALLMSQKGWDEPKAHRFLQLKSMNSRKSLSEIAEAFLLVNDDEPGPLGRNPT